MDIVGLNGFARSGKDTAAKALIADGWSPFAFASPIRESMLTLNALLPSGRRYSALLEHHGGDWDACKADPVDGVEFRRLQQAFGTEVGRDLFGQTVWIDQLAARARAAGASRVVVTDVRFVEEAEWVRSEGGVIVEVTRPGVGPANGHKSERPLPRHLIDTTVANDGSIAQLHARVRGTAEAYTTPVLQAAA